jgi:sugar phosphate isomerase/epimerase
VVQFGVITDEISEDFEHVLDVCNELGIRTLELRSIWNKSVVDHDDATLQKIKKMVDDGGFNVVSIASPFLKTHITGEAAPAAGNTHSAGNATRSQQSEVLARTLHVAEVFDAPVVRTFSFWRVENPESDSVRNDILAELTAATETVKAAGRLLALENEHACNIGSGEEAKWYLDRIPDTTFGLIWDPGNQAHMGLNPVPDGYNAVRGRIHHVHLKDAVKIEEGSPFTTIGEGAIDFAEQFRLLQADGYTGAMNIETHFNLDGSREPATRACIAGVRRIAAEVGLPLE